MYKEDEKNYSFVVLVFSEKFLESQPRCNAYMVNTENLSVSVDKLTSARFNILDIGYDIYLKIDATNTLYMCEC